MTPKNGMKYVREAKRLNLTALVLTQTFFFYEDGKPYSNDVILIGTVESGQENLDDLETGPVCAQLIA